MDNPKDKIGAKKVPLGYFPPAGLIYGALAFEDGALKYQSYNWRSTKVSYMTYLHAIKRHVEALIDGEDIAEDSQLPHIAHIIANGAILADATEGGFIVDDRPPKGPAPRLLKKYDKSLRSTGDTAKQDNSGDLDKASLSGFGSWKGGVLFSGEAKAFTGRIGTSNYVKPLPTMDIDSPRSYAKVHAINEHDAHASCQCVESEEDTLL